MQDLYLILENGQVFAGKSFGCQGEATGELVFTTSMVGYLETLTDPSYCGQIVIQTFPLMGNYGVIPADFESEKPHLKAYIVREWCQEPSNFRSEGDLDTFLVENNIIGLCGVDTRALTRIIREHGVMNARITTDPQVTPEILAEIAGHSVVKPVADVTAKEITESGSGSRRVVLWDFGAKRSLGKYLEEHDCQVITVPAGTSAEAIMALHPDGIMLSNGPGNPADNDGVAAQLQKLLAEGIPVFGVSLGHQILALAKGAKTYKLHYGHRGSSQPVKCMENGKIYITGQNQGYAVQADSLPENAVVSFVNANDGVCEGIDYVDQAAFSVQFYPETSGGPQDTSFLYDRFFAMIDSCKEGK